MERKIGEIFEYNGEWYQCILDTTDDNCNNCYFQKSCGNISGDCSSTARSDGKSVAFKKLEKVGELYEHYGKFYQCYKLPMETEIRLLPNNCYPIGKDNLVEIEIKQTKEDMEEKKIQHYDCFFDKKKSNLKPFDIQKAKEGKPVCTRDGRKARIICFDAKSHYPIIALVETFVKEYNYVREDSYYYTIDGRAINIEYESKDDLMMLPEKKEGWVNVYKYQIHDTPESAEEGHKGTSDYIKTIRVEWEEQIMAWVAVDKDGRECIYQFRPKRGNNQFIPLYEYSMWMALPKGTMKKLIGKDLTWEDNPVELKEE